MSRHGTILTIAPLSEAGDAVREHQFAWLEGAYDDFPFPRAKWLTDLETELRPFFPRASSRDLNVTARYLAPFPLERKP